jgi:hypothetical protein
VLPEHVPVLPRALLHFLLQRDHDLLLVDGRFRDLLPGWHKVLHRPDFRTNLLRAGEPAVPVRVRSSRMPL